MTVNLKNLILGIGIVSFLSLQSFVTAATAEGSEIDWRQKIEEAALKEMSKTGAPSLQIAVGLGNEVIFEGAYGLADVENAVPAQIETRYRIASVSKWMTATAAFILSENDQLDIDGAVQAYCAHYPAKKWPISVRHLLTHTSGIRHYRDYEVELSEAKSSIERGLIESKQLEERISAHTRYTNLNDPIDLFKDDKLLFEPGSDWEYSSLAYRLLGCVIEGAAKQSYNSAMSELVFEPAGMQNTLPDDSWAIIPGRASGYRLDSNKALRRADMRDVSENLPAGGHLSTATDMVRFAIAFKAGDHLLSADARERMKTGLDGKTIRASGASSGRDAIPSKKYGHGLMFFPNENGSLRFGHIGQQEGGSAIVVVVPDKDIVLAVLTNVKGWKRYISFTKTLERIVSEDVL